MAQDDLFLVAERVGGAGDVGMARHACRTLGTPAKPASSGAAARGVARGDPTQDGVTLARSLMATLVARTKSPDDEKARASGAFGFCWVQTRMRRLRGFLWQLSDIGAKISSARTGI